MKKHLEQLLRIVQGNTSDIPFKVRFWDGDSACFGSGRPLFTLIFRNERSVGRIFSEAAWASEGNIKVHESIALLTSVFAIVIL